MRWTEERLKQYNIERQARNAPVIGKPACDHDEPESRLTARIGHWCAERGYPHFHDRSRGKNSPGWPDHTIVLPGGVTLFVEDKSKRGRLTEEQRTVLMAMKALGHEAHLVRTWKQFEEMVRHCLIAGNRRPRDDYHHGGVK